MKKNRLEAPFIIVTQISILASVKLVQLPKIIHSKLVCFLPIHFVHCFQTKTGDTLVSSSSASQRAKLQMYEMNKLQAVANDNEFNDDDDGCRHRLVVFGTYLLLWWFLFCICFKIASLNIVNDDDC